MSKKHYLPSKMSERVLWLNNFSAKIGDYSAGFGISSGEVTQIEQYAGFYDWLVNYLEQLRSFTQEATAFKNRASDAPVTEPLGVLPPFSPTPGSPPLGFPTNAGVFPYIIGIVKRIKALTTLYTPAIGEDLGIIGDESTFDPTIAKPVLKVIFTANHVRISFDHPVEVAGVRIYSQRPGEADFSFLADDTNSPYDDNRPNQGAGQAETRKYKAFFIIDSQVLGLVSDVVSISVNVAP